MGTIIYSPGIRVRIETAGHGIIDVTEDLTSASLTIREEAPSRFSFVLLNHRRKYDGIFTPNDIVSVKAKRTRWLPVFSGYLNQVPFFSSYPRNVPLTATDTLKRLQYRPWDPSSTAAVNLMQETRGHRMDNDGGMRDVLIRMLNEVGDWNLRNIHIGRLPEEWSKHTEPLRRQVLADMSGASSPGKHGASGTNAASPTGGTKKFPDLAMPGSGGRTAAPRMAVEEGTTNEAITGLLSVNDATVSVRTGSSPMALTGETQPRDEWYVRMRFPYSPDGTNPPPGVTPTDFKRAKAWWKNKPLLVSNPKNLRSVVLRAADWGGAEDGIEISEHAMSTVLGAAAGDVLDVRFAPDDFLPGRTFGKGDLASPLVLSKITDDGGGGGGGGKGAKTPDTMKLPWEDIPDGGGTLQSNAHAARAFIAANWNPVSIGGYRDTYIAGTSTKSDHAFGLALDCMVTGTGSVATGAARTKGNSIALWFTQNPQVFDTKYVIWMDRSNSGSGWSAYDGGGGNTLQHRDHVHISFKNTGRSKAGPMGGGWPGSTAAAFGGDVGTYKGLDPGGIAAPGGDPNGSMLQFNWTPHASVASQILTGYRALMNDTPLLNSIDKVAKASMRSYMAGPNGDFIAWFPDYFGAYGTAAKMNVRDIELAGDAFSIVWDDSRLVTHQYAVGSFTGVSNAPDDPAAPVGDLYSMATTQGIASVEFPELMEALFNVKRTNKNAKSWLDPDAILKRFGARPNVAGIGMIANPAMEFWYACRMFQKNWASQFSSRVQLTFMPEVWPGMLLKLESFGFQAYVEQVTHTFTFEGGMGGGFRTDVNVIAPSSTKGGGLFGLPVVKKREQQQGGR